MGGTSLLPLQWDRQAPWCCWLDRGSMFHNRLLSNRCFANTYLTLKVILQGESQSLIIQMRIGVSDRLSGCETGICFPGGRESACNAEDAGDLGWTPGLGRGGHANPLQYSCLENPMDRGARQATVHGVAKSWTWLKWLSMHACTTALPESSFTLHHTQVANVTQQMLTGRIRHGGTVCLSRVPSWLAKAAVAAMINAPWGFTTWLLLF